MREAARQMQGKISRGVQGTKQRTRQEDSAGGDAGDKQAAAEQPVAAPPRLNSSSSTFNQQVTGREQLMDAFELDLNQV